MRMSDQGRALLTKREGVRLKAYKDTVGVWTIGIGHTSAAGSPTVTPGLTITAAQCDEIFRRDLVQYENAVNNAIKVPLAQHQFDACVSLCYNIGTGGFARSSVVRKINAGDMAGAAEAFMMWIKPPEITGRRRTEVAQFKTPYSGTAPKAAAAPAALPVPTTAPVDTKDAKQGAGIVAGGGILATAWSWLTGNPFASAAIVLAVAALVYWFLLRPVLRRMSALDEFYAAADEIEGGLLMRVRLALKGVKSLLWGRFLALAGIAAPLLQFTDVIDFSTLLPPIKGIPAAMYVPLILGPVLAFINNALRKAATTPAGQTDLALPTTAAPPLVPEVPAIQQKSPGDEWLEKVIKPKAKRAKGKIKAKIKARKKARA